MSAAYRSSLHALAIGVGMLLSGSAQAGHFSGANITYRCLGGTLYEITLDLFRDCTSISVVTTQSLTFQGDCGTSFTVTGLPVPVGVEVSQLCAAELPNSACSGGALPGMEHYQFVTAQNLAACNDWTISWQQCCRSATVNLVGVPQMYVDANLDNATAPCNNSPVFTDQSVPYVCVGQPVNYNYGVTEPDGHTIDYTLVNALQTVGLPVGYQGGFTGAVPAPGAVLDPNTGQLTFTPALIGNYVFAVQVREFDSNGVLIGWVRRDIMFVAIACTGVPPTTGGISGVTGPPGSFLVTSPTSIEVCDGALVCVDVEFTDPDPGTTLQLVSQALALLPGATFTVSGTNPAVGTICWTADAAFSPVNVLVEANDGACPIVNTAATSINFVVTQGGGLPVDAGTNGTLTICATAAPVALFASIGGTPDVGGVWTAPGGAAYGGTYDPVIDAPGVYTYTVGNACGSASSTVTVTESPGPNAGTNGTLTLCSNGAATNMFASLGGAPQAGGTWTGPGGAAHGANYDPAVDGPGVYTYTVAGVAPCGSASATVTVTENAASNAGTNGTLALCSNSAAVNMFASLGGAPQAGGAWTGPGGVAHAASYDPALDAPGVYTYTVVGGPPCGNASATVTVTETAPPNAGTNGNWALCSNGAPVSLFAALGGGPQAGGTWTAPGGVPHGVNYDPALDAPGVYTYTVLGTAPCANATSTVTVAEGNPPNVGTNGTLTVCSNSAAVNMFASLGGSPLAGGTWTAPGGAAHGASYNPAIDGPGVYTYSIVGVPPCGSASATVTVTENTAPDAGANGVLAICGNGVATGLFASLGGAPQAGGTWTGPGGAAHSGTYDPVLDAPGIYTYTLIGTAPCANASSTVTVTENAPPNAGANGTLTVCSNSAAVNMFASLGGAPQAGGTWTGPGGVAHAPTYDPAIDAPGTYTYTVAGVAPCANATATVTVTENAAPNAGANGSLTICGNGVATGLFASLGGAPQAGGTWTGPGGVAHSGTYDPVLDAPGIYTYTLVGTAPCANASSTVTVTENAPPNAGANGTLTVCSNSAAVNMFASLGGAPQAGGTWTGPGGVAHAPTYDPAIDAPGIYTYTVAGVAPCANATATVTVTENTAPNAGANGSLTICGNGVATGLFASLGGAPQAGGTWTGPGGVAHSGTYDPVLDAPGVYTYTLIGTAPCANASSTVTVTENAPPNAGANGTLTVCSNSAAVNMFASLGGAPQAGGTWTGPGGVAHAPTYDPAIDGPGTYTYTVAGVAPCANATATVTVTENTAPNAGANGTWTLCGNDAPVSLFAALGGGPQAGGSWTDPGGLAHGPNYDPALDAPGVYTYTVVGAAPCANATSTVTVSESAPPNAGTNGTLTVCSNNAWVSMFASLGGAPQAGGTWTSPGGIAHGPNYDPALDAPGVYTYTVLGIAPCANATATVTVTENTAPDAGLNAALNICSNGTATALFALLGGTPQAGGSWSAPGGVAHSGTYDPALDAPGVYTYTIIGTAPCVNATSTVTVTENAAPSTGTNGTLTLCSSNAAVNMFASLGGAPQAGGAWTAPGGLAHGASYDPAVDAPGVYTYTVAGIAPCANASSTVTVVENIAPDAGLDGAVIICDQGAPVNLFLSLGGTPDAGGTWSAPGGGAHSGTVDPSLDPPGNYVYLLPGTAPCANATSTVTVTITSTPTAGSNGALSLCANGAPNALFVALGGSPDPGGSWTAPGGGAHSGTIDPTVDPAGVYTYNIAAVPPCVGASATVTVTINSVPDAGSNGSATLCTTSAAINLVGSLGGSPDPGGSWTAPGGVAHSGTYDPVIDAPGAYTYSIIGIAPCGAASAIVTVTEVAPPNAGADATLTTCGSSASNALFALLVGAQPGGTWTGPGGAAHGGTYDPSVDVSGVYTYTLLGTAPCLGDVATVTVTENIPPDAGSNGSLIVCDQGAPQGLFAALGGSPDAGGSWTDPNGNAHSGTIDPSIDPAGNYTYTVNGLAPCGSANAVVAVTITSTPNAGTNGSWTLCEDMGATSLFAALGGGPDAGGTWTDPNGNVHSGTLDPSNDPSGVYTYTIAAVPPCLGATSSVTVTISALPDPGINGSLTVCDLGAPQGLFAALGGSPDAGGSWTDPNGNAHSGSIDPSIDPAGNYTYTVNGVVPCGNASAVVAVTITSTPNAGTNGSWTLCEDMGATSLFAALGGGPDAGGTWTDPNGSVHSGTLDPANDPSGVYTYTIAAVPPCLGATSSVTVTINALPDPGINGSLTVCDQGAPQGLFAALGGSPDAGGSWTDPNGNAHSGTIDPTADPAGNYTYTVSGVAPCGSANAVVAVTITSTPNAGTNGSWTLCEDMGATSLFAALGGGPDAGGTWTDPNGNVHSGTLDPANDPSGVYTYTIAAVPPCLGATSSVTVTINALPDPGFNGSLTVCDQGAPQGLFAALGGSPDAGGSWTDPNGNAHSGAIDPTADPAGNYTYTVNGVAPCGNASAVVAVTITSTPDAGTNGMLALCDQGALADLFNALGGTPDAGGNWTDPNGVAFTGILDPSTDPAGSYTYTVPATAPCSASSATVAVSIEIAPDAGIDGAIAVCTGDAPFTLFNLLGGSPDATGSWTDPNGLAFGATFDPGTDPAGTYTYTVAAVVCPQDQSSVVVTVNPGPDAGLDNAIALCSNGAPIQLTGALLGTPDLTGSWTDPNGVAFGGTFDPSASQPGVYTYTVPGNAGCPDDVAELTMAVSPEADAGTNGTLQLCSDDAAVDLFTLLGGAPDAGGAWTDPNGVGTPALLDPSTAVSGTYTYTVTGLPPCADASAVVSVTITLAPDAGTDASVVYCNTSPAVQLFNLLGGAPQAGGSWTDPNGNVVAGTFDPALDQPGAYTYRIAGTGSCSDAEAVVIVSVSQVADAGSDGSITVCSNDAPFALLPLLGGSPDVGGTWADPNGNASNGMVDPFTAIGGNYTYTVQSPVPCPAESANVIVTIIPNNAPVITVDIGTGCAPVMANITSSYTGPGTCVWDLGNGTIVNACEPDSVLYTTAGAYDLTVTIDPGNGCEGTFTFTDAVIVVDQPTASFHALPDSQISINNTEVFFVNTSTGANAWLWQLDSLDESATENALYVFPNEEPGEYEVCLIAYASETCADTACHQIIVLGSGFWIPNAFTPNGDGDNDLFAPVLGNPDPEQYRFAIYDRWGQPLFESNDPAQAWNANFAGGLPVPDGVYVWKIWLREPFKSDRVERTGHVTVVR